MNASKLHFIGRLPKRIGGVFTTNRNFTSDRGLWLGTVLNHRTTSANNCLVQTSSSRRDFQIWVEDKKDGYRTKKEVSSKQHVIDGFKMLKSEFKLWKEEVKEHFRNDPILVFRPGEIATRNWTMTLSSNWTLNSRRNGYCLVIRRQRWGHQQIHHNLRQWSQWRLQQVLIRQKSGRLWAIQWNVRLEGANYGQSETSRLLQYYQPESGGKRKFFVIFSRNPNPSSNWSWIILHRNHSNVQHTTIGAHTIPWSCESEAMDVRTWSIFGRKVISI